MRGYSRQWRSLQRLLLGMGVGLFPALTLAPGLIAPAQAQRVIDVTPGVNSKTVAPDTSISGVFENDADGAVKASSVQIFLNGEDITTRSTITRTFFSYRPATKLAAGDYTVRVDYESTRGQLRSVSWMFTVRAQPTLSVSDVSHNAADELGPGATFLVTLKGSRGGRASVMLVEDGRTVREIQAQESSAGVYTATLPVTTTTNVREGIVIGRLAGQGQVTYGVANQPAIFSSQAQSQAPTSSSPTSPDAVSESPSPTAPAIAPKAPEVTSHRDGDRIRTRGFTLVGTTNPNAEVTAIVTATTPILGGVVNIGGDRLVNQIVKADAEGRFEVEVPSPALLQRDTRYTIELTTRLKDKASETTMLELRQR